jgi:hypothetical protein
VCKEIKLKERKQWGTPKLLALRKTDSSIHLLAACKGGSYWSTSSTFWGNCLIWSQPGCYHGCSGTAPS